jgi:hypothetical protein
VFIVNNSAQQISGLLLPAWVDLVLFKLTWVGLVIFQSQAVFPVVALIALKILTWPGIIRALPIVVLTFVSGLVMDSLLMVSGVFVFPSAYLPLWLILLWLSFSLTLPRGFYFITRWHPLAQSAIGIFAGCLGYFAGYLMGAVSYGLSIPLTMLLIGVLWAGFVPLMIQCEEWILKKIQI